MVRADASARASLLNGEAEKLDTWCAESQPQSGRGGAKNTKGGRKSKNEPTASGDDNGGFGMEDDVEVVSAPKAKTSDRRDLADRRVMASRKV